MQKWIADNVHSYLPRVKLMFILSVMCWDMLGRADSSLFNVTQR